LRAIVAVSAGGHARGELPGCRDDGPINIGVMRCRRIERRWHCDTCRKKPLLLFQKQCIIYLVLKEKQKMTPVIALREPPYCEPIMIGNRQP
jgi:hypothetical protein